VARLSWLRLVSVATLLLSSGLVQAQTAAYGLESLVEQARANSHQLELSRLRVQTAQSKVEQTKAAYYPSLTAKANVMLWDSVQTLSLGSGMGGMDLSQLPAPSTPYENLIAGLLAGFSEPMDIRNQVTAEFSVTLAQPLTALYTISLAEDLMRQAVAQEELSMQGSERSLSHEVVLLYFQILQVQEQRAQLEQTIRQLESRQEQMQALIDQNVLVESERLKLDVAIANVRQGLIQLDSGSQMLYSMLATRIGESPDAELSVVPVQIGPLPEAEMTLEEAYERASQRLELQQLELGRQQAEQAVVLNRAEYIPSLALVGSYTHSEGQGLAATDMAFVGLFFEYTFSEWGGRSEKLTQSELQLAQLDRQLVEVEELLKLDVKRAYLELESARSGYAVAELAIREAEQAYEVESSRLEYGQSTATELIALETQLLQARSSRAAAFFGGLIAHAQLHHAMGDPLDIAHLLAPESTP
jgi:outer membrane protein TolC